MITTSNNAHLLLGIDPGMDGAVALANASPPRFHVLAVHKFRSYPGKTRGRDFDWAWMRDIFYGIDKATGNHPLPTDYPRHSVQAFVERVGAMPKQGGASVFKFGYVAGGVRGALTALGYPVTMVEPGAWKRWAGLIGASKDASASLAAERHPAWAPMFRAERGSHTKQQAIGMAEAVLIAEYAGRVLIHNKET